jgi:hypothetical protein
MKKSKLPIINYSSISFIRPFYLIRHEGESIPNSIIVFERIPYILKSIRIPTSESTYDVKVVPMNHRYFIRVNLWLVTFETSFVWPRVESQVLVRVGE